ncbi:recombination regulator RecX [Myxococcota bacterium]|nr:recombination regulator RecX [Myxococcota bacterium]
MEGDEGRKKRRERALRLLATREVSQKELADRLRRWGAEVGEAEALVASAREAGLIDEARLARSWVAARKGARGVRALSMELRRRGVPDGEAEGALAAVTGDDQRDAARVLLERAAGRLAGLAPDVARRRAWAMLARRGFGGDVAAEVVDLVLGDGELGGR